MLHILVRCSQVKIPMTGPNEPNMLLKGAQKEQLGIYHIQIQSSEYDIGTIILLGQLLDIT